MHWLFTFPESGYEGGHRSVPGDVGRIGYQFLAPHQARFLTEVDNPLEEATEDIKTEALPHAAEPGGIRQCLIQVIAEGVPDTEAIRGQGEEFPL